MLRRIHQAAIATAAATMLAATAHAQATCGNTAGANATCTPAGVNVTTTVQNIVVLSITPASAALTAPTDVDFAGGGTALVQDVNLHQVTVRANAAWTLTVLAPGGWTGTGNNAKAIGDLGWSTTGGAPYTAVTGSAVTVSSGAPTASTVVNVSYGTNWDLLSDTPGTYTLALTYRVTAP